MKTLTKKEFAETNTTEMVERINYIIVERETQESSKKRSYALAAANIRKELRAAFPGEKFSVKSNSYSMGDSVHVDWSFGPSADKVNDIVKKYQYGYFNSYEDIYENSDTFSPCYGETKFTICQREFPEEFFLPFMLDVCAAMDVEYIGRTTQIHNEWANVFCRRVLSNIDFEMFTPDLYAGVQKLPYENNISLVQRFKIIIKKDIQSH